MCICIVVHKLYSVFTNFFHIQIESNSIAEYRKVENLKLIFFHIIYRGNK